MILTRLVRPNRHARVWEHSSRLSSKFCSCRPHCLFEKANKFNKPITFLSLSLLLTPSSVRVVLAAARQRQLRQLHTAKVEFLYSRFKLHIQLGAACIVFESQNKREKPKSINESLSHLRASSLVIHCTCAVIIRILFSLPPVLNQMSRC